MNLNDLISEYRMQTEICAAIDYSDMVTVKRNNRAVSRMYSIVEQIGRDHGEDGMRAFAVLLEERTNRTDLWAATHLLERLKPSPEIEREALVIIEAEAAKKGADGMGYQVWLKNWKSKRDQT